MCKQPSDLATYVEDRSETNCFIVELPLLKMRWYLLSRFETVDTHVTEN